MLAKIPGMRTFTKRDRMQADSLPEIRDGLNDLAHRCGRRFRVGRRPASEGHVINAAVVLLLGMDEAERESALGRAFERINALLALDEPSQEQVGRILAGAGGAAVTPVTPGEGPGEFLLPAGGKLDEVPVPAAAPKRRPKRSANGEG